MRMCFKTRVKASDKNSVAEKRLGEKQSGKQDILLGGGGGEKCLCEQADLDLVFPLSLPPT